MLLSIDPGLTGACALFEDEQLLSVIDFSIIRDQRLAWIDARLLQWQLNEYTQGHEITAVIERAQPNPKNGAIALFSQGLTLGSLLVTLQLMDASIEFVSPGMWKAAMGLSFAKDIGQTKRKAASISKARLLYPKAHLELAKHHNRAEAILIGHWYRTRPLQLPLTVGDSLPA